jgi:ataxia telangiectasia mutated family protein
MPSLTDLCAAQIGQLLILYYVRQLHQVPDTVENSRLVGSAPATKRIKKNDRTNPILALAPFVQTSRQPESRLLALQTLYFVIERHWSDLFLDVQAEILSQLLSLTKDSDLNIQQWTFVCLASVSTKRRLEASREFGDRNTAINGTVAILNRTGDEESIWQEVWTIALRRTNLASGTACRGACLMVHALMLSGTVTDASISTALSGFFEEIISQGPAYTSDAVCAFVKVALDYAERDTKLYRLDHHQKVIAWFRYNWRVAQDIRTGTNAVSTSLTPEAVELLAKVAGSSDTPTMWIETPLIASDVFQHMTEELETSPIRQYLLYAALPIEQASRSTKHRFPLGVKLDTLEGTATQSNLKKTRQILELLHDTVKDVSTTIDLASALKMKNLIDLSIFAILVSAVITSSQEDPEHIAAETACDLLERVLAHTFKESNHGAHERAMILSSLTPILSSSGPRRVRDSRSEMWPTLTLPDGRAGVTTLPSFEQPEALDHSDHPLTDRLLVTVWRIARVSRCVILPFNLADTHRWILAALGSLSSTCRSVPAVPGFRSGIARSTISGRRYDPPR